MKRKVISREEAEVRFPGSTMLHIPGVVYFTMPDDTLHRIEDVDFPVDDWSDEFRNWCESENWMHNGNTRRSLVKMAKKLGFR